MAASSSLSYPNKSHRKDVSLPSHCVELAEFFGIMMGDGGINNPWQANVTLNATADKHYAGYVARLCKSLFGIAPVMRKRKSSNAVVLQLSSTTIVDFLVENGLCRGNKLKQGLQIPQWILTNAEYRTACVRGLVDTDGCIYVHSHEVSKKRYRNIGLTFSSYSEKLLHQVARIFEEFGIIPHITTRGTDIYLYRASAVARYLKVFGTSNERLLSVYRSVYGGVG